MTAKHLMKGNNNWEIARMWTETTCPKFRIRILLQLNGICAKLQLSGVKSLGFFSKLVLYCNEAKPVVGNIAEKGT